MSDLAPVIELLAENLHQLHTSDGEVLNFVPLQHDSDMAKQLRRNLAEGIVLLLEQHGHIHHPAPAGEPGGPAIVRLACGQCSGELITVNLGGPLNGRMIIQHMAQRDPECGTQHAVLTPDQIRQRIQERMSAEVEDDV